MVKVSQRDLAIIAGLAGVADILTEHRFTIPLERAVKRIIRRGAPVAARGAAGFIPRAFGTARFIAMRHPYVTAAVVTYEVVKNREQIAQLAREGWEVIQPVAEPVGQFLREEVFTEEHLQRGREAGTIGPYQGPLPGFLEKLRPKRKASAFNKAVSQGMRVVKKSTSYGKKGEIKPAKKAFTVVVKLAAAKKKKKKAPKSGIRRKIWNAMVSLR